MLAQLPATDARDRWFAGTFMRIIAGRDDTDGAFTVLEQRAARDFSPPLHRHQNEDTALLVLAGEMTVRIDGAEQHLGAGGFAWLPRARTHTFRIDSDEAHFLEFALPGGVEGFHVDASDPALEVGLPTDSSVDVPRLVAAARPFDIEIVGPPMGPAGSELAQ